MAAVAGFCIDRWEATLDLDVGDGAPTPHDPAVVPEPGPRYVARSSPGVFPQGYVNRLVAAAACENAGKRLCDLREWYRACTGPQGWTYPYGPTGKRGLCNTAKPHLLGQLFGNDPRVWKYDEHFNSPELLRTPGYLAKTGEYPQCASAEGVHDLVGNLHEWVADRVDHELPHKIPLNAEIERKIDKNLGHGIFMGGFFSTTSEHGQGCRFLTPGHEPKYHDYSTGFRCCRDPG
jgi:sulfatase modifying factor 1